MVSIKVVRALQSQKYTVLKDKSKNMTTGVKTEQKMVPRAKLTTSRMDNSALITSPTQPVTDFNITGKTPPKNLLPAPKSEDE